MLTIIPPSTSMDMSPVTLSGPSTVPVFESQAQYLISLFRNYSAAGLSSLFGISEPLAEKAYREFLHFDQNEGKPAIFAFSGALYKAMDAAALNQQELDFAQKHIRIESSVYGILKPLDGIKAFRSTFFLTLKGLPEKTLVRFWYDKITDHLIGDASRKNHEILYLSVLEMLKTFDVRKVRQDNRLVVVTFRDWRDGTWKIIREYEKPAIADMVNYILKNQIDSLDEVKEWSWQGYRFNGSLSDSDDWVFTRKATE